MKGQDLGALPSELFREHIYFTFQDDYVAFLLKDEMNIERMMWANDFPHSDSTWPHSQQLLKTHLSHMSEKEKNETFHVKSLKQKAAIVFAGPFANFIFALILLFLILLIKGTPTSVKYLPIIDNVLENSAAYKAGFKVNDKIILVNGNKVTNFLDIRAVSYTHLTLPTKA